MAQHIQQAREEVRAAADAADGETREQINSLDEGLMELGGGDKTDPDGPPHDDRVEEIEEKLGALSERVPPEAAERLERAEEHLSQYRRARGTEE